ncbi:hypothetical protein [Aquimarina rubra]|uniref:Uncharacterized protein n=1 Tax=Aquimarina rubra TaxID=1920033 RepID=A0ABW5LG35_9FLAO
MEYQEFFEIEVIHPYFSGISADLVLAADIETGKRFIKLGYVLKKTVNGIKVLAPFTRENNSFRDLGEEDNFTFYVYPTSEYTQEITDFSEVEKGNMIFFTNEGQQQNNSELIASQVAQEGFLCGYPALARIVITAAEIDLASLDQSITFRAIFGAKSIKWKYYFVSDTEDSGLSLESRNDQVSFNEIVVDENTTDQIINSIQLNFPNTQVKVFESKDLVPYSRKPIKNIKLLQNGDVLINHLPNPQKEKNGIQIIRIK